MAQVRVAQGEAQQEQRDGVVHQDDGGERGHCLRLRGYPQKVSGDVPRRGGHGAGAGVRCVWEGRGQQRPAGRRCRVVVQEWRNSNGAHCGSPGEGCGDSERVHIAQQAPHGEGAQDRQQQEVGLVVSLAGGLHGSCRTSRCAKRVMAEPAACRGYKSEEVARSRAGNLPVWCCPNGEGQGRARLWCDCTLRPPRRVSDSCGPAADAAHSTPRRRWTLGASVVGMWLSSGCSQVILVAWCLPHLRRLWQWVHSSPVVGVERQQRPAPRLGPQLSCSVQWQQPLLRCKKRTVQLRCDKDIQEGRTCLAGLLAATGQTW